MESTVYKPKVQFLHIYFWQGVTWLFTLCFWFFFFVVCV